MLTKLWLLEERAEALLLAIGITGWFLPTDVRRIESWTRTFIAVRRCAVTDARWRPARRGMARILVPDKWSEWQANRAKLHEFAHTLLDVGVGPLVDPMTGEERRAFPLAAGAEAWEEWLADELVLMLRMPARLVAPLRNDPDVILRRTGLPPGPVNRRLAELERNGFQAPVLTAPPRWSAGARWALEGHAGGTLRVVEAGTARFVVPVNSSTVRARTLRLQADLVALRPREFAAKYALYRVDGTPPPRGSSVRSLPVCLEELYSWAADRSAQKERGTA